MYKTRRFKEPGVHIYRTAIIPGWSVGDAVEHKPSGFRGVLDEMATLNGELWKMRVTGASPELKADPVRLAVADKMCRRTGRFYHLQVHARDLVALEPAGGPIGA
jgi:hypothetical protein